MKTRITSLFFCLSFLTIFPVLVFSQAVEKPVRPFQLSLLPLIGTEGLEVVDYRYKVSLNIFAGINGGVEGLEMGGFLNINKGFMQGLQGAGFMNIVHGELEGIQGAGFGNIVNGPAKGIQGSGFGNIVNGEFKGFQGAGFMNVVNGSSMGFRGAGFGNISLGMHMGFQGAGFMNASFGMMGFSGAGFANFSGGNVEGFQGAGFANFAGGRVHGVQLAGFMNLVSEIEGIQGAGFINIAGRVDGIQIGVINISDTIRGVPIGVISYVRRGGYRVIELAASDALLMNASIKTGVRKFYNIFSFGFRPFNDPVHRGFGYGLGTNIDFSENLNMQIEGHVTQLHRNLPWKNRDINFLNELRITLGFSGNGSFQIFVGPVIYNQILREDPEIPLDNLLVSENYIFRTTCDDYVSQWWLGARGGIRINLP
jgi:hypothetical protein